MSGQGRRAIPLLERSLTIQEKKGGELSQIFSNLAIWRTSIGDLAAAESNLRRSIELSSEFKGQSMKAIAHNILGLLHAYRGVFKDSKKELTTAFEGFTKIEAVQSQGIVWSCRAIRSLLMSNADDALKHATKARELADVKNMERDIIQAEYLLGAAYVMQENLTEAEQHLTEALTRNRKINLVELEPDILLEFAKLRFKQNHKKESLEKAEEALQIADRCEYRLKQADIHNFLAAFYLDAGDLKKANEHAEKAKERAECGYKPALEKAEKILKRIEKR